MQPFKNITEIRQFCKSNSIPFAYNEGKESLLKKIENFSIEKKEKEEVKVVELKCFNAYEFGQLYKLSATDIQYLNRKYGKDHKETYGEWIKICKSTKVVD